MRSFEERKAEVFRRSEKIIKKRRKNYMRIMTACFSVCVIFIICSSVILQDKKVRKELNETTEEIVQSTEQISKVHNFISVSVDGSDGNSIIKEYSEVTEVFYQIYDICEMNGGYKDITMETEKPPIEDYGSEVETGTNLETETTERGTEYIITMQSVDGTVRKYKLNENIFYDVAHDKEIVLSDNQLMKLKYALYIKD